jgi:hypothetical protein
MVKNIRYVEIVEDTGWFEYFIKSSTRSIKELPFLTKADLEKRVSSQPLRLIEERGKLLAKEIANNSKIETELYVLMKLLIEECTDEGYVTKEELKALFIRAYDQKKLRDYSLRHGMKGDTALAKSSLLTMFHRLIEQLRKKALIKEYFRQSELHPNGAYKVYWNFAIQVYKVEYVN